MIEKAMLIISDLLPNHIKDEFSKLDKKLNEFTTKGFFLSRREDVPNTIIIYEKRLSRKDIEKKNRINLEEELEFMKNLKNNNSLWHGYLIKNRIRWYFVVDIIDNTYILQKEKIH